LAEEKEHIAKEEVLKEEKRKLENRRAPHLVNLNEDIQLSQAIYYPLSEFPVKVGR
jgi:hypothetical protein